MVKIALFTFICLLLMLGLFLYQKSQFEDGKLHIVFCDVGQGDAMYIRTPSGKDLLFDGGPNDRVLSCLSKHMPFWNRTIEFMELSHPHADHLNGLIDVSERYKVEHFVTEDLKNTTQGFKALMSEVQNSKIKYAFSGDRVKFGDGVTLQYLGPSKAFLQKTSPNGKIGESREFGSLIALLSFGDVDILLTGDSQVEGLSEALEKVSVKSLEVLQVPHHGSKYGLDDALLKKLSPQMAVISVGKKNKYGHPAPHTLTLLQQAAVKYFRTDEDGEIEIVSDGKNFEVK